MRGEHFYARTAYELQLSEACSYTFTTSFCNVAQAASAAAPQGNGVETILVGQCTALLYRQETRCLNSGL
jgi:hypothetical protein